MLIMQSHKPLQHMCVCGCVWGGMLRSLFDGLRS